MKPMALLSARSGSFVAHPLQRVVHLPGANRPLGRARAAVATTAVVALVAVAAVAARTSTPCVGIRSAGSARPSASQNNGGA
jgi:hypothetical protein